MTPPAPQRLVHNLHEVTRELLSVKERDLDQVEKLLAERSAVLTAIAACDPVSFSPVDLASLHSAVENGNAAIEKFSLLRRKAAGDWHRVNRLRDSVPRPGDSSISVQG